MPRKRERCVPEYKLRRRREQLTRKRVFALLDRARSVAAATAPADPAAEEDAPSKRFLLPLIVSGADPHPPSPPAREPS